jgi:hypothetical protein
MNGLYLIGTLAANVLLVGFNLVLFGRGHPQVGNRDAIAERLKREIPGFSIGECAVAADGSAALVENLANGVAVLVQAIGDQMVVRKLSRDVLRNAARDGTRISLWLKDFTLPRVDFSLDDEFLARTWEARLSG